MTFSEKFLSKDWFCANPDLDTSDWVLAGIPYDGTCSYRPGTRFASEQIRLCSKELEDFSSIQYKTLEDVSFFDAGDLDLPTGNRDEVLDTIYSAVKETLGMGKKWFGIGGEHLVTYPEILAYIEKYPNLAVIHFDAHSDLRDDYLGQKLSHATVMKRIADKIGPENIAQIGIRSCPKDEWDWMIENKTLLLTQDDIKNTAEKFKNQPVFITIDVDVLDPSIMPGTGTPEAGGLTYKELISTLLMFKDLNVVGADVVEVSPPFDTTGLSVTTAAKLIRELLIMIGK